jgi:hypothetical protein
MYDTRAQVEAAVARIKRGIEESGGEVLRDNNRFEKPVGGGYRDYHLNFRYPNGFTVELQLNTRAMVEAKNGLGHTLYEAMDKAVAIINDRSATIEQRAEAGRLWRTMNDASEEYYKSTGDQSNVTASLSETLSPFINTVKYSIEKFGSSRYPELVSLLERIRKSLPSSESTKGTPSQSIKESTNTGSLGPPFSQGVPSEASRPSIKRAMNGLDDMEEPPSGIPNISPVPENVNASTPVSGKKSVILSDGNRDAVHYEVRELAEVIPSHDPGNGFARREDYPAIAQERPYHSDRGEQDKVRRNALEFEPAYLVNNNPTAGNGPPIITKDGIVLGGNSRAMSLGLVYEVNPEKAGQYRQALVNEAAVYGIDGAAVQGMKQPVLVRVLETDLTPEEMAVKSRQYNQSATQALQAKAEGVSKARFISPDTLAVFAKDMEGFDSLREYLASAASKRLVAALENDGVLERTQIARLVDNGGRLNDEGKALVENALRGLVVADYDTLAASPAAALNKLDRAVPALARLKARGGGWDLSGAVTAALRQIVHAESRGINVDVYFGMIDMVDVDADKRNPAVQALALLFDTATQKETQARFELFARLAERQGKGQGMMVARRDGTPAQAFDTSFLKPLAVVDGEIFAGFNPSGNELHAALQWAHDNGGRGHSVSAALEKAHKGKGGKDMARLLGRYSGAVNIYAPHTGNYLDAGAFAAPDELAPAERPAGAFDAARMNVHGEPRRILLNALELAVDDVANGRPVDVGRVGGLREAIGKAAKAMGREDYAPDFTPEAPEVFTPAPETAAVNSGESPAAALLREQGIGPDGVSLEERMVMEREARGELDEDARAELLEARDAEDARQRIEEKGYELLGCVMDAKE